jgi:predicted metalloprotease with PDZ domain
MGYRDMRLYGTMFDGMSLRGRIGVEMEFMEMLEMVQRAEKVKREDVQAVVAHVKKDWVFQKPADPSTLEKGAAWYIVIRDKAKERGWLGVSVQDITEEIAKSMKLKDRSGALIADVFKGDPADKAGLKSGDVVTEINDKKIRDTRELLMLIAGFRVGETVKIKVLREGQEKLINITIAERKEQAEIAASLMGLPIESVTAEVKKIARTSARSATRVIAGEQGAQRSVVVERRVIRKFGNDKRTGT